MSYGRNSIASVVSDVRAMILKWEQICPPPQEMIGNVWGRFWLHLGAVLLASGWGEARDAAEPLQSTGRLPRQRMIWLKMSIVPS